MCAAFSYKGTRDMVIVGQKHNIEMTRHFYDYLSGEIARLADVKWEEARASSRERARSWKSSFYNGAVDIVVKRLHRKYQQVSQESERSQALVLKNERDLDGAVASLVGRVGRSKVYQKRSRRRIQPGRADREGHQAGQSSERRREIPTIAESITKRFLGEPSFARQRR